MRVDDMWLRVKRRLASQQLSRSRNPEDLDPLCEHDWTVVEQRATWSGLVRLSRCAKCPSVLREWFTDPVSAPTADPSSC